MKLLSASDFSLRLIRAPSRDATPLSELMIEGAASGKMVECAILEAAVEWEGLILAFMTDDVPYEEFLHIYLFDQTLAVIDSASLGGIYSTGVFSDLALCQPDELRFRFIGGITWRLKLMAKPRLVVPFMADPTGVSRPFGFYRRFILSGKPLPNARRARVSRP